MLASDKASLIALELHLLKPEVRASADELMQLIHDDFYEFGASGDSFGKEEVISRLPQERCPEFTSIEFELRVLSNDLAQLLYRASIKRHDEVVPRYSLRSSLWKYNVEAEQWQMIFHQGTPCEPFA